MKLRAVTLLCFLLAIGLDGTLNNIFTVLGWCFVIAICLYWRFGEEEMY